MTESVFKFARTHQNGLNYGIFAHTTDTINEFQKEREKDREQ